MVIKLLIIVALLLSFVVPYAVFYSGEKTKKRFKNSLAFNVIAFFGILIAGTIFGFSDTAMAAETATTTTGSLATGLGYIAAALATGLSGIGGGIAVASAAGAALGAISEDSTIFGKSLIFLGLAEGVALYGLIISFMILGKL